MPYDVVGNAAGLNPDSVRINRGGYARMDARGRRHFHRGGRRGNPLQCMYATFCFLVVGGMICLGMGASKMIAAMTDSRGAMLKSFSDAVRKWNDVSEPKFVSTRLAAGTSLSSTTKTTLSLSTDTITPKNFGEETWSTKKIKTPLSVSAESYSGTVKCDAPNKDCTLSLTDKVGNTVAKRTFKAATQRQTHRLTESRMCQWYDSDWWHPMAAVGMGNCNAIMTGPSDSFGPSECVVDHYLDRNGCPNDVIQVEQLVRAGWDWAGYPQIRSIINQKPRFTYDQGKCWDYTDCFCTGCGRTFKTDVSKGWGFTGFGYYYNGQWTSFPKPLSSMTGTEKAQQCYSQFNRMGYSCPASEVNLVCFRAGGYPKQPCSRWCKSQDVNAVYTPPQSFVTMSSYYGPWGQKGSYPQYHQSEARCSYIETDTTKVTQLAISLSGNGAATNQGAAWDANEKRFKEMTTVTGKVPLDMSSPVPVQVLVRSEDGPVIAGRRITNGCGPVISPSMPMPSHGCFGATQGQNLSAGILLIAVGAVMLCGPMICMALVAKGIWSCFSAAAPAQAYAPPAAQTYAAAPAQAYAPPAAQAYAPPAAQTYAPPAVVPPPVAQAY